MVDGARLAALLHRIQDEVEHLRELTRADDDALLGDANALPAAKYRLIVAIEAATDAASHIIASEGLRPATSFADAFRSLGEGGWIDDAVATACGDAARFRNLLVHQYARVDDRRVLQVLRDRLSDLEAFVEQVARRAT